jgi:hypothetical protein
MNTFKHLRIFGGSTSVPENVVTSKDSFWGLTAQALQIENIVNYSCVGCSLDSICHILVSEQHNFDLDADFFLIVIPPLERLTVFDNHKNTKLMAGTINTSDWELSSSEVMSHHGLMNVPFAEDRTTVIFEDRSWTEVVAMRNLYFLTKWLDSINVNYLIVNGSKPLDKNNIWLPSDFLLPYCVSHPRIKVFDNTYSSVNIDVNWPPDFDIFGWFGHHGAAGNQHFFDLGIYPSLKELNLC